MKFAISFLVVILTALSLRAEPSTDSGNFECEGLHHAVSGAQVNWQLVCFVWFEALSSHSQQHLTVTSRSAAMALAIMLSAIVIAMPRRPTTTELYDQLGILWAKLALVIRKR